MKSFADDLETETWVQQWKPDNNNWQRRQKSLSFTCIILWNFNPIPQKHVLNNLVGNKVGRKRLMTVMLFHSFMVGILLNKEIPGIFNKNQKPFKSCCSLMNNHASSSCQRGRNYRESLLILKEWTLSSWHCHLVTFCYVWRSKIRYKCNFCPLQSVERGNSSL